MILPAQSAEHKRLIKQLQNLQSRWSFANGSNIVKNRAHID